MHPRLAICPIVLLLVSLPSRGAELFYLDHDPFTGEYVGPVGPLVISGEILPGDYDRLLGKISGDEKRFFALNKIILASDGGDVAEAMKIGALLKSVFTEVIVGPLTGRCVSACFFIFAAAGQREADGARLLGINRPFIADADTAAAPQAEAATAENKALAGVRAFLRQNDVPDYLVDEMFRHASDDAYWLSAEDEKNLGTRSKSFSRYLAVKCGWNDSIERDVYARKKPLEDFAQMWKCRSEATQADARKALALACKEKSDRQADRAGEPKSH